MDGFAGCSYDFEKIGKDCIENYLGDFKEQKLVISGKDAKAVNKIYFYKTASGNLGKLKINNVVTKKNECALYLDVLTYLGRRTYTPNGSYSVQKEYGTWSTATAAFDNGLSDDFVLKVKGNQCGFVLQNATLFGVDKTEQNFEGSSMLYVAGFALLGFAVFLITMTIFKEEDQFKAQSTLEDADEDERDAKKINDLVIKYSQPLFKRYFSPLVKGMKGKRKIREKYKRRLASAGLTRVLDPEDFFAFKLFLIIGFPILFLFVRWFVEADWPMILIPLISVIGFVYPDIWIKGKIDQRKEEIAEKMPFIVDMLALSVEAGLDFMAAIQKVIEKAPPSALADEFEILIKDTRIGASRADGLRQLAWRVDLLQVSSFCATLIAADSVGASIGPILKTLAAELRQKRTALVEKKAATAATKILFPTLFFIVPAVFIMIAAPILIDYVAGN